MEDERNHEYKKQIMAWRINKTGRNSREYVYCLWMNKYFLRIPKHGLIK